MAENKQEYFLRNINEKFKNKNIFAWKFLIGWLIMMAFSLLGTMIISAGTSPYGPNIALTVLGALFLITGLAWFIANAVVGIIALYKSTKDTDGKQK